MTAEQTKAQPETRHSEVRSDALLGRCVKCGERLRGHEDENGTHCRWCVTGWTPEDANTGQEAQANEHPNVEVSHDD